jgi:capsular polysaccharide transport system permease protein
VSVSDGSLLGRSGSTGSVTLVDHIFIIRALLLRDLRLKYLSQPAGIFLEFLRPTLVCVLHYVVFLATGRPMAANIRLEQFIWGGFTIWLIFSTIAAMLHSARVGMKPPFPGATTMHMRMALAIWPVIVFTSFTYISVGLMIVFGDGIKFPDIPLTALLIFLTLAIAFGWGLLIEGIGRLVPLIAPITHFIPWLLFLSSGIYFSTATIPPQILAVDLFNPVLHLVEFERYAFDPGYPVYMVNLTYPALCAAILPLLGLALNRHIRRVQWHK